MFKKKFNLKHLRALVITTLIFLFVGFLFHFFNARAGDKEVEAAWYGTSGWQYRKALVIDASKVSGSSNLTNFPVLVSRTDTDLKDYAQSDGDDILFTSADGQTKLDHEIETYTSSTGQLIAWVEIPTLDYDDDTTIYMYYGNSSASSQQNATGVWTNYASVLHLKEDASSGAPTCSGGSAGEVICDSTGNANHGDGNGDTGGELESADRISAKIGFGLRTDDDPDYVSLGDIASTRNISQLTISYWQRRPAINNISVFGKQVSDGLNGFLIEAWDDGNIYYDSSNGTNAYGSVANNVTSWQYLTMVYDGSLSGDSNRLKGFINDTQQTLSFSGTLASTTTNNTQEWRIGRDGSGGGPTYRGEYDEARIYLGTRTPDWIATEYANQNDPAGFFKTVSTPQAESQVTPDIYYAMDEGYGSALNSTGSNNYTGTISGALWRTEDLCISGKCLYFDGSNDAVTTSGTTSNVRTVSFWVRPITTTEQLVDLNGSAYIESSSGTLSATGFTSPTIYINGQVSSTLVANRWQHVVVTTSTGLSASALRLGQISTNYGQMFLDEFQLYTTALTESQVKSLYNSRGSNITSVQQGAYDQKSLSDGLVGYWKMDESSWTVNCSTGSVLDSSGNGNNGAACPNSTGPTGGVTGVFGNAGHLDGSNDSVQISHASQLDPTGDFSISGWVNPDVTDGLRVITSKGRRGNDPDLRFYSSIEWGSILFGFVNGWTDYSIESTVASAGISAGQWFHYVGTYNSSSRALSLYVNGRLVAGPTVQSVSAPSSTNELLIGSGWNSLYFDGSIDESRVYNRVLSQNEISQLYNWAPGPVGHWKMDENNGTNLSDSSGNNLSGTLSGFPAWVKGKFGSGVDFDGATQYATINDTAILRPEQSNWTVSLWARPPNSNQNSILVGKYQTSSPYEQWSFNICGDISCSSSGQLIQASFTQDGSNSRSAISTTDIADGNWHHYTFVANRSADIVQIYVDGVPISQTTSNVGSWPTVNNTDNMSIGRANDGTFYYDGDLDEVKIYNYARTPSQIIQDMNAGHPLVGTPIAAPVAHWSFDEGYGTIANDQTPNNNDLTLNSASWTNDGKFNKAWTGTGSTKLTRADDADFDFAASDDFSISVWARSSSASNPSTDPQMLVDKGENSPSYSLYFDTSGRINFGIDDDASFFPEDDRVGSSTDYYDGNWHHYVAVKQGTSAIRIYVDGILNEEDTTIAATGTLANSDFLVVGSENNTDSYGAFSGTIDEVKIYRAALSASDVQSEYNQGKTMVLGATGTNSTGAPDNSSSREYCVPGDSSTCNPPVAEWKFDERTGSSAFDTSGNNLTGTLTGNTSFSTGKLGSSILLDGTSDYVRYGDVLDFADGDAFTISLWFMPTGDTQVGHLVSKKLTGSASDIGYSIDWFHTSFGGNTCLYVSDGTAGGSDQYEVCTPDNSTNTLNRWYHLVAVYNNTDLTGSRIYLNGVEYNDYEACNGCTAVTEIGTLANANGLCVGTNPTNSGTCNTDYEFTGKIDDVRIYNYTRTPAQVAWDYNKGKPIAHWQFDETSGTTAYDATGNNNTGTLTNTPTRTTSGKINSAISFDGADDVINAGSASMLDNLTEMTVTAWINPTTYGESNYGRIVDKGTDPTSSSGWSLFTCNDGGTMCTNALAFFINFGAGPTGWWSTANNSISTSRWSHAAVTYNRSSPSNDPIIYINGQPSTLTERNTPSGSASSDAAANLLIGNRNAGDRTYNGLIDDVRIYNYILTPDQIRTVMNDGSAIKF